MLLWILLFNDEYSYPIFNNVHTLGESYFLKLCKIIFLFYVIIFYFQEGAKSSEGVIVDYDKFIIQKINEFPVTLRFLFKYFLILYILSLYSTVQENRDIYTLDVNGVLVNIINYIRIHPEIPNCPPKALKLNKPQNLWTYMVP